MRFAASILLFLHVVLASLVPAPAAEAQGRCLSRGEQRQEVRSGNVVRPGQVGRSLGGKVLRLRLCRGGGGLVWQVQVLMRDGRVKAHVVDARSGRRIR